ncbi:MAG TPA: helix-turn-helix transcriptional regulator [Thermoanaerobaculia bacterium]
MAEPREHPDALRLLVVFLRFHARMSQAGLAGATRLAQSRISMLESGDALPAEDVLRRIASATGVRWELVTHLRRYVNDFLYAAERGGAVPPNHAADPVPLAISAYLLEDMAAQAEPPSAARETAERFWKGVAGLPPPRRRRVIELSPRASRSWALAELLCHESERAAADGPQEALELAELALSVAGRVEGNEEWRRRIQGYAWAYVGNARRVAEDPSGANAAFAKARELWGSCASPETSPLQDWRLLSLEAPR